MTEDRHEPAGGGGPAGAALAWIVWWELCAALWLLLVDNTHVQELGAGALVAVLGATGAVLVRAQRRIVTRPRPRWLLRLWKPVVLYPRDLVLVTLALLRRSRGRLVAVPYEPREEVAREAASRELATSAGSFAPNTYVVGADEEAGLLLVHQLVRRERAADDADPLGLR
jgi:multisubunit Na+/H+ antiporter MnhE subunit